MVETNLGVTFSLSKRGVIHMDGFMKELYIDGEKLSAILSKTIPEGTDIAGEILITIRNIGTELEIQNNLPGVAMGVEN